MGTGDTAVNTAHRNSALVQQTGKGGRQYTVYKRVTSQMI